MASTGSASSGAKASAIRAPWMNTTGSPSPCATYSSSIPSTWARCICRLTMRLLLCWSRPVAAGWRLPGRGAIRRRAARWPL